MKTNLILLISAIVIIILGLSHESCNRKESLLDLPRGKLMLNVSMSIIPNDVNCTLKSATIEDYKIEIFITGESQPFITFDHASDIPEVIELPIGEYHITASSPDNPPAAFESPYYYGESETFTITDGMTSQISISCSLANIMVTVIYSDQVKNSFSDYNTTVSNTSGGLTFTKNEIRKGYFNSGPLTINSTLEYNNDATKILTGEITNPVNGKHYEIRIDANSPEGTSSIDIQLNEEVETEIITLNDGNSISGEESEDISYGDLLITEIMYNPYSLDDSDGEWIEIYNNSTYTINLKDLIFRRGSNNDLHQINSDVQILPETYAVLGRTATSTDNVSYVYGSDINLVNGGDELFINTFGTDGTDGEVICSVDYGATGFSTSLSGKSIQLNPTVKDATEAQIGSNWCISTQQYSTGDYGTPGLENSICN